MTFQVRALSSATVGLTAEYMNYTTNYMYELVLGVYGFNIYYTQLKWELSEIFVTVYGRKI